MNIIKHAMISTASILTLPIIDEAIDQIVDRIPKGISLMNTIPNSIIKLNDYLYKPYTNFEKRNNLSRFTSEKIIGPIYEELVYRIGIQNILLKELPKRIFSKNKKICDFLDSKTASIARIITTAYFFAALHYSPDRDGNSKLEDLGNIAFISTFMGGVLTGALVELTKNPLHPIIFHCAHNIRPI